MQGRIEIVAEKKFVGKRYVMSFSANTTYELWKEFMPARTRIRNCVGTALYSIENYPPKFFDSFDPHADFENWAAVEVADFSSIPDGMETFIIPAGKYAVFVHRGAAGRGQETYEKIFMSWLPNSGFVVDARPHFAVMGENYKHEDPESEEEIWIPVRPK
ncbi:MAG: GyrI-like domain-containing protein [Bacteroidetes bacterium]|nr:GyrI-like domain-containing protein [Bacteroidota bacterium]